MAVGGNFLLALLENAHLVAHGALSKLRYKQACVHNHGVLERGVKVARGLYAEANHRALGRREPALVYEKVVDDSVKEGVVLNVVDVPVLVIVTLCTCFYIVFGFVWDEGA